MNSLRYFLFLLVSLLDPSIMIWYWSWPSHLTTLPLLSQRRGWLPLWFCTMTESPTFSVGRGLVCSDHCFSAFMLLCPRAFSLASARFIQSSPIRAEPGLGRKSLSSLPYRALAGDSLVSLSGVFLSCSKALEMAALSKEPSVPTLSLSIRLTVLTPSSALELAWGFPTELILWWIPYAPIMSSTHLAVRLGPPSEVQLTGTP